ncbi:hypothetical protein FQR65_LT03213 [Abscondita terminalis]|nr:hypothetical protein FQR65_LT03213 [Abscondita terminalis]
MSGQWEVVSRKKGKDTTMSKIKPDKVAVENKKNQKNTPKIEEVLPLQQVKNLYNVSKNKENQKPPSKPKSQENGVKKVQKKVEKPQAVAKPKLPKSIESALNSINVEELQSIVAEQQRLFPDAPLVWLKDIVKYISQHIPIEITDHTFSSHPEGYPLSIVPSSVKNLIEKSIKDAGKGNAQVFFDLLLTTMANDMSKNMHTVGHKLYIQYLAMMEFNFVALNLSKHVSLRTSYQNRPPIGLSILWSLGQVGLKDFHSGLKVFQEVMLPIIEMKNYSRYIVKYLISLVNRHDKVHINVNEYLLILDVIFANYKNFPNDLKQDFQKIVPKLEVMLLSNSKKEKLHAHVEVLLKKLLSSNSKVYKDEICKILIKCFIDDQNAISSWTKLYSKCLPQSAILLNYLSEKWNSLSSKFNKTMLSNLLNTLGAANEEILTKKRKEAGVTECIGAVKRLKNKMVSKKKSKGFPYKFCTFVLVAVITGVIYYDIRQHGTWQNSRTFKCLKDYGILQYYHKAIHRSGDGLNWVHVKIDEQIPGYYETVSEYIGPYKKLARELSIVFYNIFDNIRQVAVQKYPVVLASIEEYAPGLIEQSQNAVNVAWSTSIFYFNSSVDYLKTEVFVGQLAPENMQKVVLNAFNTTQQKAVEYYHWIYEKVQSSIK